MSSPRRPSKSGGDGEQPARTSASLKEYRAKRDFGATSEPSGAEAKRGKPKKTAAKKAPAKKRA
ncbi:MAG: hypothetical protein QOF54_2332, partial [Solirubrobacteraceae bacterium]|nr:hypothetical protein [Solirubrobacteraceae bacterium]